MEKMVDYSSSFWKSLTEFAKNCEHPFFIYRLDQLSERIQLLRTPGIKLWYACKANPLSSILKTIAGQDLGLDVASEGELIAGLKSGFPPENILCTGPLKSRKYLETLVNSGVKTFVLEGPRQLDDLYQICADNGVSDIDILLRFQLEWETTKFSVLGGNQKTPFGMTPDEWENALAKKDYFKVLNFKGIHAFQWGNITDSGELESIWKHIITLSKKFANKLSLPIRVVDLGGGLGLDYEQSGDELDLASVKSILQKLKKESGLEELWLELGRILTGPIGSYLTKVGDMKKVRGENLIITEGGVNHILRPVLTDSYFPCTSLKDQSADKKIEYSLHGPLCTALDRLGTFKLSTNIQIDDWIAFTHCGAYGFTESMPFFLCHTLPGEAIFDEGEINFIRRPGPPSEWMK
jgi:diaminopimelate decarboxylase